MEVGDGRRERQGIGDERRYGNPSAGVSAGGGGDDGAFL